MRQFIFGMLAVTLITSTAASAYYLRDRYTSVQSDACYNACFDQFGPWIGFEKPDKNKTERLKCTDACSKTFHVPGGC